MATVKKPAKKMQMGGDTSMMKMGGTMAKNGKKFPDLNKDGKITKADILKGRGVIAKKGTKVEKAENGIATPTLRRGQMRRLGRLSAKNPQRADRVASRMIERDTRTQRGEMFVSKKLAKDRMKANEPKPMKSGGKMAKPMMKSGGKAEKCKYGCK
jgi:hypothetical protein